MRSSRILFCFQEAACTDIRFGAENNIFGEGEQLDNACADVIRVSHMLFLARRAIKEED